MSACASQNKSSLTKPSLTVPKSTAANPAVSFFESRVRERDDFLRRAGVVCDNIKPMREDCAFRRYYRVERNGESLILMESVPDSHKIATPGHSLDDFVRLQEFLSGNGVSVPAVYATDRDNGYILMEDFGDRTFKMVAQSEKGEKNGITNQLYEVATDVLLHFSRLEIDNTPPLPDYRSSHVHKGRRRMIDWYMPVVQKKRVAPDAVYDYLEVWNKIEAAAPACPQAFLHVDFHMENLMWRPDKKGLKRCGVLDFQGAMTGPFAYDIANLLEDPRFEIDNVLRGRLYDRFYDGLPDKWQDSFAIWYRILATQFHCRAIGQFVKLALMHGKQRYLQYIPRLETYIRRGLQDPALKDLAHWFDAQGLDFAAGKISVDEADLGYISDDAF